MEADASLLSLNTLFGVLLVDILLSGDNAIVIALVCRTLPLPLRARALWLGVLGAFLARLVLTGFASLALNLPLLKLVGGLLLLKISVSLILDNHGSAAQHPPLGSAGQSIFQAAQTIILADLVMSLDNVVALSAITQNNFPMLLAGLLLSIPILMFGSMGVSRLLDRMPWLIWVGGALLGGVAGALIVDDPVFGGALNNPASLTPMLAPALSALFVLQWSRVISANRAALQGRPVPRALLSILFQRAPATLQRRPDAGASPLSAGSVQAAARAALRPVDPAETRAQKIQVDTPRPAAAAASERPTRSVAPAPQRPRAHGAPTGDYRVVLALGLFMLLTGGVTYYLVAVYEPPIPQQFLSYRCTQPAMTISFSPGASQIRFATARGVVMTPVQGDRIVWDDYREAGTTLGAAPPVKIVLADAGKLVIDGGMFSNAACDAQAPR